MAENEAGETVGYSLFTYTPARKALEKPTQPGFYYFRYSGEPGEHIWVAQVRRVMSGALFATVYSDLGRHTLTHRDVETIKGTWFGPLPSPESFGA